jgi:hypothetical protein
MVRMCCSALRVTIIQPMVMVMVMLPSLQIPGHRLIDLEQRSLLIDEMELMLIHELMVTSAELPNGLIAVSLGCQR